MSIEPGEDQSGINSSYDNPEVDGVGYDDLEAHIISVLGKNHVDFVRRFSYRRTKFSHYVLPKDLAIPIARHFCTVTAQELEECD